MPAPINASKQYVRFFFTSESVDPRPTSWEVALHTKNPGTGDDFEVSEPSYSRVPATFTSYVDPEGRGFWEAKNLADISFPAAGAGASYSVSHYTVRDATTGEALASGALTPPIPVVAGTIVSFPKDYLKIRGV